MAVSRDDIIQKVQEVMATIRKTSKVGLIDEDLKKYAEEAARQAAWEALARRREDVAAGRESARQSGEAALGQVAPPVAVVPAPPPAITWLGLMSGPPALMVTSRPASL